MSKIYSRQNGGLSSLELRTEAQFSSFLAGTFDI